MILTITLNVSQFYDEINCYLKSTCYSFDKVKKLFILSCSHPSQLENRMLTHVRTSIFKITYGILHFVCIPPKIVRCFYGFITSVVCFFFLVPSSLTFCFGKFCKFLIIWANFPNLTYKKIPQTSKKNCCLKIVVDSPNKKPLFTLTISKNQTNCFLTYKHGSFQQ
jgi:hypothetical protein